MRKAFKTSERNRAALCSTSQQIVESSSKLSICKILYECKAGLCRHYGTTASEGATFTDNCLYPVLQLENYIQDSIKQDMVQIQQTAVHNHTATMIEIGTNLLSQTAEQTRKLTNVEAQVRLPCLFLLNTEGKTYTVYT